MKKWITRFRLWLWRRRRRKIYDKQKGELREFVYLDEVSVYSLIASRLGPVAAEFTETQTKTLEREISGVLGVDSGVVKSDLNSRRSDVQTQGSQILRKSTVQTTFKELYDFEESTLAFKLPKENEEVPRVSNLGKLIEASNLIEHNSWIIDSERLSRGQLLEMEVQLETEPIYHLSTFASVFLELFEDTHNIASSELYDFTSVRDAEHILTKLLVGLIPVRGQAIDYKIVTCKEKEWIVHNKLLSKIQTNNPIETYPLFVVGVTEQPLFWKDIRRVLFSKARFRVFCRMAQDGLQDSWTPVKLVQVLETIEPNLANKINAMLEKPLASINNTDTSNQSIKKQRMCKALICYAKFLAHHYNKSITAQNLSKIEQISQEKCNLYSSQAQRYEAFETISTFLLEHFDIERDPDVFANNRELALKHAGLNFSGEIISTEPFNKPLVNVNTASDQRLLDTEFIAIYW